MLQAWANFGIPHLPSSVIHNVDKVSRLVNRAYAQSNRLHRLGRIRRTNKHLNAFYARHPSMFSFTFAHKSVNLPFQRPKSSECNVIGKLDAYYRYYWAKILIFQTRPSSNKVARRWQTMLMSWSECIYVWYSRVLLRLIHGLIIMITYDGIDQPRAMISSRNALIIITRWGWMSYQRTRGWRIIKIIFWRYSSWSCSGRSGSHGTEPKTIVPTKTVRLLVEARWCPMNCHFSTKIVRRVVVIHRWASITAQSAFHLRRLQWADGHLTVCIMMCCCF